MRRKNSGQNAILWVLAPVVLREFRRLPWRLQLLLAGLAVLAVVGFWFVARTTAPPVAPDADPATGLNPDGSGTFLFCFWNVENLFDDRVDDRRSVDEPFDLGFATDAALRNQKYHNVAKALLAMNGGKGPDVIAACEVESVRAATLLQQTLNRLQPDARHHYPYVAMQNLDGGRHIAPCVISRLTIDDRHTQLHGRQLRILETRLRVNGHELTLFSSHWTSQLRQRDGSTGDSGRRNYAETLRGVIDRQLGGDPDSDILVCGDFNAVPESPEVKILSQTRPPMTNLFAGLDPRRYGTTYYRGELIYDQIVVSQGMQDARGWGCDPASVETVTRNLTRPGGTRREPWRFGPPASEPAGGRGFADHFPVTLTLTVAPRPSL